MKKILEILYNRENFFVEEIDRIEKHPEQVSFLAAPEDENSGLLFLTPDDGSSDWSMVRLIGDFEKAFPLLRHIPYQDAIILIDATKESINARKKTGNEASNEPNMMVVYESSGSYDRDEIENWDIQSYAKSEFGLPKSSIKTKVSPIDARLDDIYLWQKNGIQGFVKVTKSSWHYAEIAIEIRAGQNNQGFGTALVALMVEQARRKGVKLCYITESTNIPSMKIASACSLLEVGRCLMLKYRKYPKETKDDLKKW